MLQYAVAHLETIEAMKKQAALAWQEEYLERHTFEMLGHVVVCPPSVDHSFSDRGAMGFGGRPMQAYLDLLIAGKGQAFFFFRGLVSEWGEIS